MRAGVIIASALGGLVAAEAVAADAPTRPRISAVALIAAAQHAALRDIDYGQDHCDGDDRVGEWLKTLAGANARAITWTGGKCRLVNKINPLDAADWPYCAQATVSLVKPKQAGDRPVIEIYLEQPKGGRPGVAYAFRSLMMTRDDGNDYERFRKDFEAQWRERFPATPAGCED